MRIGAFLFLLFGSGELEVVLVEGAHVSFEVRDNLAAVAEISIGVIEEHAFAAIVADADRVVAIGHAHRLDVVQVVL